MFTRQSIIDLKTNIKRIISRWLIIKQRRITIIYCIICDPFRTNIFNITTVSLSWDIFLIIISFC